MDKVKLYGKYEAKVYDANGKLVHETQSTNTVVTVGKNIMFNTLFAGSSYTVTGPYMGLISSASFSAVATADTMQSHAGWLEAGNANAPTYTSPRPTALFAGATGGSITLSTSVSYSITGTGTIEGAFMTLGTGAVSTIDSTAGTLFNATTFSSPASVATGFTVLIGYTVSA